VPSLALPLWLVFAAASGTDSESAARAPKPSTPAAPVASATKPVAAPSRPVDTNAPKAPATPSTKMAAVGKAPPAVEQGSLEEPEEEVFSGLKSKGSRKNGRKAAVPMDRPDPADRRVGWSPDRYAAVVPPGLTLAALHSQLSKTQGAQATEPGAPTGDPVTGGTLADIERAREALRQETARLEALLKATGNCGGGVGMPIGDSPAAVSPMALREAPTEQIDSVSKAMKGMKPEQAAALVARLDRGLAAEIMRRMKPADAGSILGLVKPELAAELATQIATRKSIAGKDKKGNGK
jgi:hypothetical protein